MCNTTVDLPSWYRFNFPTNNRAKDNSVFSQVYKCCEELSEVLTEVLTEPYDKDRVLEETLDLIHAAEGVLSKFTYLDIETAYLKVLKKNTERGDYK